MSTIKNFGGASSGYLDPEGRNWETTVYSAGKPLTDKELNLAQDLADGFAQGALKRSIPSGWISDDFLGTSISTSGVFISSPSSANLLAMPQDMVAHVNGWLLKISHTGVLGGNQLTLPVSPLGGRRTDIVVLEVWRKLIAPSPSTVGKSASGRIWLNGNVKNSSADDTTLNLIDDIFDSNVGEESTKRVQIQYRLRVLTGADVITYPFGIGSPSLVANTTPASAGSPDGSATSFVYLNQLASGDAGLWRAGDGDPNNGLGTVDGYMYAIPMLALFRRNSTAFNRNSNQNGAGAFGGASGRPDGLFYDIFHARDVLDLRVGVSPTGWDYQEVLEKNLNVLLDNTLCTEIGLTGNGGGVNGHTVLWADEIGITAGHGGDNTTTGDTPGAAFVGEFDATRRFFSDRATYEILTVKLPQPGGGWASSTSTVNFTSITSYPYGAFNYASFASGSIVMELSAATFMGASSGKKTFDALANVSQVTGLGAVPIANVTVKMDALSGKGVTDEDLYLEFLVCYPPGLGLTYTPTSTFGSASYSINNSGALPSSAPVAYSALANTAIDSTHREVQLQYTTVSISFTFAADTVISSKTTFRMPERVNTIVSVLKNGVAIAGSTTISSDGRVITLTGDSTNPGDVLAVTYTALRPLPQNNEQLTIWYEARLPQTAQDSRLSTSLSVTPRYISPHLYILATGSGSYDDGYPFPTAYVQTGGVYPGASGTYTGEHELSARAALSLSNFGAATGFLKLPALVPMSSSPEGLTFARSSPGDTDAEGRTFFSSVSGGTYLPNAYAQDLSDASKHKVVLPILAELNSSSALGLKGQLVLVLLVRWASDSANSVFFDSNLNLSTTSASVLRLKGNLLSRRA